MAYVAALLYVTGITSWSYNAQNASRAGRRHDNCVTLRSQYDGQIFITKFFGEKLGATPAQLEDGLSDLREKLGPRPKCG